MNLSLDERSYEIFLNMYFTTRSFQEVKNLVSQMKSKQVPFTTRASMVVIKTAMKTNSFDDAMECFRELKKIWTVESLSSTPSSAPAHIVAQLVDMACKEHKLVEFLSELSGLAISEDVVNAMPVECVRQKDVSLTTSVEKFAREQGVKFTDSTYSLLIKG